MAGGERVETGTGDGRPPAAPSAWTGRRRRRVEPGGRTLVAVALTGSIGALVAHQPAVLTGALALGVLVVLDAVSAHRALPGTPPTIRALGDGTAGEALDHEIRPAAGGADSPAAGARRPLAIGRDRPEPGRDATGKGPGPAPAALVSGHGGTAALAVGPRGLYPDEQFTVATQGPLGLVSARRGLHVRHDAPLAVGPAPVAHDLRWPSAAAATQTGETRAARGDDLFRGVRPYRPGDSRRRVHWPSTARRGSLMVRETEGTGTRQVRIVAAFPEAGADAEQALGRAAWAVATARRAGWDVSLVTCEGPGGRTIGRTIERAVTGSGDAARRLAAAVAGTPVVPSAGVATRWITPEGDRWR
jgi:uncharacterized protein (DUF58 family)